MSAVLRCQWTTTGELPPRGLQCLREPHDDDGHMFIDRFGALRKVEAGDGSQKAVPRDPG